MKNIFQKKKKKKSTKHLACIITSPCLSFLFSQDTPQTDSDALMLVRDT